MFTGLVQAVGRVRTVAPTPAGRRLVIDPGPWPYRPSPGESIAISGCCLTVTDVSAGGWAFDVVPETLAKTTLGSLGAGSRVNLEHAVTPSTLMGGHFVQGHIDGTAAVARVQTSGEWRVGVTLPAPLQTYMIPKGSVAVDGVSLTIAAITPGGLEVALIPTTLEQTTLRDLKPGDRVNIEADMLVKTVMSCLQNIPAAAAGPPMTP